MTKTKSKTADKKATAKKAAPTAASLPTPETAPVLPRGQERLPNGDIRLKSGAHDLGRAGGEFVIAGVKIKLKGKVLVANKNVDWLSIGKCQKCGTPRPGSVNVHRAKNGVVLLTYRCSNVKECDLGGRTYVQPHDKGRFSFTEE